MTDGKIYITISDQRGKGGGVGGGPGTVINSKKQDNETTALGDYAKHEFFSLIKQNATKIVNYSIGNMGNFSGDYLAQTNINATMSNVSTLASYGLTAAAGAKYGGIYGAAIAVGVKMVTDAVSFGLNERTNRAQYKKTNYEISKLKDLSGLNALIDVSRGTQS